MSRILLFACLFCFVSLPGLSQDFSWGHSLPTSLHGAGHGIVQDGDGNVITAGNFVQTIDLDPGPATLQFIAGNDSAGFVTKFDASGTLVWGIAIGDNTNRVDLKAIETDPNGNLYLAGSFEGTVDFDPGPATTSLTSANGDAFVLKLNSGGNLVWVSNVSSLGGQSWAEDLVIDANGNIYCGGRFGGAVDFDPGPTTQMVSTITPAPWSDAFLWKLDSGGNLGWVKQTGGSGGEGLDHLLLDRWGNIYTTGYAFSDNPVFPYSFDADPGPQVLLLNGSGFYNQFLQKFDASGNLSWATMTALGYGGGIALDGDDELLVTGTFFGTIDMDPGPSNSNFTVTSPNQGIYLQRLDSSGSFISAKHLESRPPATYFAPLLETDSANNIYWAGAFLDSIDLDPGPAVRMVYGNAMIDTPFFLKLDSSEDFVWGHELKVTANSHLNSFHVDGEASIALTGQFNGQLDLDPTPDTSLVISNQVAPFVSLWAQDSCSDFSVHFDSISQIACQNMGLLSAAPYLPNGQVTFQWNTGANTPLIQVGFPGIYTVYAYDSIGCAASATTLLNPPPLATGFDLQVHFVQFPALVGFPYTGFLSAYNNGCLPVNGQICMVPDSNTTFVSSTPSPDLISGDTLIWNLNQLTADSGLFQPSLHFLADSTLFIGDLICYDIIIKPLQGDLDTTNNILQYCSQVTASYDPNDKNVYPPGICDDHFVEHAQSLNYTLRFQNTGNAPAVNIELIDTISPDLDLWTIRIASQSHPNLATWPDTNGVLHFRHDNIFLPDSTSDPLGSQGYIIYEIQPQTGLPDGTRVENFADIYFDFNDPIRTNTVFNTYVSSLPILDLSVGQMGNELTVGESGASYQWIDCSTGNPIPGATSQSFTPLANGQFAVEVTSGGCSGTSDCYSYPLVGLSGPFSRQVSLFPNPSEGNFKVAFETIQRSVLVEVYSITGEMLLEDSTYDSNEIQVTSSLPAGLYLIKISADGKLFHAPVRILR